MRRPTIGGRAGTRAPSAGLTIWIANGPRRGSGVALGGSDARVAVADGRGVALGSTSATGRGDVTATPVADTAAVGVRLDTGVEPDAAVVGFDTSVWGAPGGVTVTT